MTHSEKTFNLIISEELKHLLKQFEVNSGVAQLLLQGEIDSELVVNNPINYISIASDRGKISYLTQDRIKHLDEPSIWSSSKRFATRPGSLVGKIFKNISSSEVEKFSNLYRSHAIKSQFKFKIVEGEDIQKYYYVRSYASESGTLGASCMKHEMCQSFFNLYVHNPETIKMLVMLDVYDKLMGRAILWTLDDVKIMDRIYTIADEEFVYFFKKWATDNGYLYKSEQNWYNTLNFENLLTPKQELRLKTQLKNHEWRRYPYLDTFKFIDLNTGVLTNYIPDNDDYRILCASEGGTWNRGSLQFDGIDRVMRHSGDCVYLEYMKLYTQGCNTVYSNANEQHILYKDSKYVEEIDDHIFGDALDHLNNIESIERRKAYLRDREERRRKRMEEKEQMFSALRGNPIAVGNPIGETWLNTVNTLTDTLVNQPLAGNAGDITVPEPTVAEPTPMPNNNDTIEEPTLDTIVINFLEDELFREWTRAHTTSPEIDDSLTD